MAIEACPIKTKEYSELEQLAGQYGALRMWQMGMERGLDDYQSTIKALEKFNTTKNPLDNKQAVLESLHQKVSRDDDSHTYSYEHEGQVKLLESVSRILDQTEETKYRGNEADPAYADSGTSIHKIGELTAKEVTRDNMHAVLRQLNLPQTTYTQLLPVISSLLRTGKVMSEVKVADFEKGIAGTVDLVHLRSDGGIDIYDLKTAYWTPAIRLDRKGKRPWQPLESWQGYKARRYSSQLEMYARILEKHLGQSVTGKYIIPIEVAFENDIAGAPISEIFVLPSENISEYGYEAGAKDMVDKTFGYVDARKKPIPVLQSTDNTNDFVNKFSGAVESTTGATKRFDIEYSIVNYISLGEDKYISALPGAQKLKALLKPYVGRKELNVYALNKIKGFDNKVNWIVIQEQDNYNLFYISNEDMDAPTRNLSRSKPLLSQAGDWIDSIAHFKSRFNNTYGNVRKMEAALIAMKLKESNNQAGFGKIGVYSVNEFTPYFQHSDLREQLQVLKNLYSTDKGKTMLPSDMHKLFEDKFYTDYRNYNQDFSKLILSYLDQFQEDRAARIRNGLNDYSADASNKQRLLQIIKKEIDERSSVSVSGEPAYHDFLLSGLYYQLNETALDSRPISAMSNYVSMPQHITNGILQKVNATINNSINKLQKQFWEDYKDKIRSPINALFKSQAVPGIDYIRDRVVGDTMRYYEPLFKKDKFKAHNENGSIREVELSTFSFHDEGSKEFKELNSAQQNFIKVINDLIAKTTTDNNIKWVRGRLPLVKGTFFNQLYNAVKSGDEKAYKNAINRTFEDIEENFGVARSEESTDLRNIFYSQQNSADKDPRLNKLGFGADNFVDMEKYSQWGTNVEVMMDVFVVQALKYKNFQDAAVSLKAANVIFRWMRADLMDERLAWNVDFTRWYNEAMINNRDIDSGTVANKAVRVLQKTASLTMIGLKPSTALVSYFGQELTLMSQAIANSLSKNSDFGVSHYLQAKAITNKALTTYAINKSDYDKIDLLLRQYRLYNQDISSILNGHHRFGDKAFFRTKSLYSLMNASEWASRAHIMIAQMLADGTWDAHLVSTDSEGRHTLLYDEKADKRFNGKGKYNVEQGEAIKKYLLRSQQLDGSSANKVLYAYDDNFANSIRAKANSVLGGFDREARNGLNFRAWGKLLTFFKNWLPSKMDKFFAGRHDSLIYGRPEFVKNPDGEVEMVWKGDYMEGTLYSLLAGLDFIRKSTTDSKNRKPLSDVQKSNIYRFVGDMGMYVAAVLLYTALPDGDDDTVYDDYFAKALQRGSEDLIAIYALMAADKFYWTPIALEYLNSVITNVVNLTTGDTNVADLLKAVPIARQTEEYYLIVTGQKDL